MNTIFDIWMDVRCLIMRGPKKSYVEISVYGGNAFVDLFIQYIENA